MKTKSIGDTIFFMHNNKIEKKTNQGYYAETKEGRTFRRLNKDPLPPNRALALMANRVDNTPARSGRLVKAKEKSKEIDSPMKPNLSKFRPPVNRSRLPAGTYVEKSKYNIDSFGEREGIPYKAQKLNALNGNRKRARIL